MMAIILSILLTNINAIDPPIKTIPTAPATNPNSNILKDDDYECSKFQTNPELCAYCKYDQNPLYDPINCFHAEHCCLNTIIIAKPSPKPIVTKCSQQQQTCSSNTNCICYQTIDNNLFCIQNTNINHNNCDQYNSCNINNHCVNGYACINTTQCIQTPICLPYCTITSKQIANPTHIPTRTPTTFLPTTEITIIYPTIYAPTTEFPTIYAPTTERPTMYPTIITYQPTIHPGSITHPTTENPTNIPSNTPTNMPSNTPTKYPTNMPTIPSNNPTNIPTMTPTIPTKDPTPYPTPNPTNYPSNTPTFISNNPTNVPTIMPTMPTAKPSNSPSNIPTKTPTNIPSNSPSNIPSNTPTKYPTNIPTIPSNNPTNIPTTTPTIPSKDPTPYPTPNPTYNPTFDPTDFPTPEPTLRPSKAPTKSPVLKEFIVIQKINNHNVENEKQNGNDDNTIFEWSKWPILGTPWKRALILVIVDMGLIILCCITYIIWYDRKKRDAIEKENEEELENVIKQILEMDDV